MIDLASCISERAGMSYKAALDFIEEYPFVWSVVMEYYDNGSSKGEEQCVAISQN